MIETVAIIISTIGVLLWGLKYLFFGDPSYWRDRGVAIVKTPNIVSALLDRKGQLVNSDIDSYNGIKGHRYGGYMELWNPVLLVRDLDLMKRVFIKDFDSFSSSRAVDFSKNDPHFNLALPNQNGEPWKELRNKLTPAFTTGKIRRMFEIFNVSSKKLVKFIEEDAARNGGEVDFKPYANKLTLEVIASAAFGIQTDIFENPESIFEKMGAKIKATFGGTNIMKFLVALISPKLAVLLKLRLLDPEADTFLSKLVLDSLSHRERTGDKREDFLQLMLEARAGTIKVEDEEDLDTKTKTAAPKTSKLVFNDDVVIAQSLVFLLAGSDTVEGLITFATYEIGINPEVQEKLYQELKAAADDNHGKFSYDLINSLPYLEMCISETLRKYPISVRSFRVCTQDYKIPDSDLVVPKGNLVAVFVYALHHDPEIWPEPSKFIPDRFTKENIAKRHPMAYIPFGSGPRHCIGNRFALAEAKVAIAHLFLNFKVEPCSATAIPLKFINQPLLKAEDNVRMRVTRRS